KDMDMSTLTKALSLNNNNSNVVDIPTNPTEIAPKTTTVEETFVENVPVEKKEPVKKPVAQSEDQIVIKSPMLGTFFRRPSPEEDEYVVEGQIVKETDTICLIEVMKLFNSIPAGIKGKVVEFLVSDGEMVEFDQPL